MDTDFGCDVLIVGAGPAGAAAARALAQAGVSVLLCERGALPRHRLCGEFVSPEACSDLAALGLDLASVGAVPLTTARVVARGRAAQTPLAPCGYGVSRAVLDAWLADAAVVAGATLRTETQVTALDGDARRGFAARLVGRHAGTVRARFVIGAMGKAAAAFQRDEAARGAPGWVALKTHLRGATRPPACVELHAFPGGYLGVAPVESGALNVCAVARPDALPDGRRAGAGGALAALVARLPQLREAWGDATADPTVTCSESGARFGVAHPVWRDVLLAGDAAALPHPVGGDGIAMALRAGRLAARYVCAALAGRVPPQTLAATYAAAWRHEFESRLRWCARLHAALERPWVVRPLVGALAGWPAGMRFVVARTRGGAAALDPVWQEVHV